MIRLRGTRVVVAMLFAAVLGLGASAPVLAAPPANDSSTGAISITTLPANLTADLTEATAAAEDPAPCSDDPSDMVSVWYRLDLPFSTQRWIKVGAGSTDTDRVRVRVVSAPGGSELTDCNDFDAWFIAHPGTTYWAVVLGHVPSGSSGPIMVTIGAAAATPAPENDHSNGAIVVTSFPFHATVDIAGATHSANDPRKCGGEQGVRRDQTLWYRLDYPDAHPHRVGIRVDGSHNEGFWVVTRPGGRVITCADNPVGEGARGSFLAQPGHTYWIVVGKGTNEHSVSEPVDVTIRATQVDVEPAGNPLPATSTDFGAAAPTGPADGPLALLAIVIIAGLGGFGLTLRRAGQR